VRFSRICNPLDSLEKRMENKPEDPIDRIRRTRHEISAKYNHDPRKLVEHYMELQEKHADRLRATVLPIDRSPEVT
jgi:hypothetical protein